MRSRSLLRTATLLAAMWFVAPSAVEACGVCFGEAEGPMIDGARMGVFMLFGLTILVQGAFGAFFITLYRRSKGTARNEANEKVSRP
ncbi:MAG: hypothetical protein ACYTFN_22180 [Planctomycetota bacterium]|jgi:hypothetical protein